MSINFLKKAIGKLSEKDKDYEEFVKAYSSSVSFKGEQASINSTHKIFKKRNVRILVLLDNAVFYDSAKSHKETAKSSPPSWRISSHEDEVSFADIVFGCVPLKSSDVNTSMKIHTFKNSDQIMISKIFHGFKKSGENKLPGSRSHSPGPLDRHSVTSAMGIQVKQSKRNDSGRSYSLSQSPSSAKDFQIWSTSSFMNESRILTPSMQSRLHQSFLHPLNVKSRSLPSQNKMNNIRSGMLEGGGSRSSLAVSVLFHPGADGVPEDGPPGAHAASRTAGARFQAFLFKHFAQVELLLQGLVDEVVETLSSRSPSSSTNGTRAASLPLGNSERLERLNRSKFAFLQGLKDLVSSPRLPMPVWLSLTSAEKQPPPRLHQHRLCSEFVRRCLALLVVRFNRKDRGYFLSQLVTGILMHHLGWIPSVVPAGGKLTKRYLMKHQPKWVDAMSRLNPYNPHWAQVSDLFGGSLESCGRTARTVLVGHSRPQVTTFLYLASYFLRCANVTQSDERLPEMGRADLFELQYQQRRAKLGQARRKSTCDTQDSGISSQEDLATTCASTGSSPTPCTSMALVNKGRLTQGQCWFAEQAAKAAVDTKRTTSPEVMRPGWTPFTTSGTTTGQFLEIPLLIDNITCDDDEGMYHGGVERLDVDYGADSSVGHWLLGGFSPRYVGGLALQGTSETTFQDRLVADLRHGLQQSRFEEPVDVCSALVADVDQRTVNVISVDRMSDQPEVIPVQAAPLVISMLESARQLSEKNTDSELCLQHLETRLQEIYLKSRILADLLHQEDQLEESQLAGAIGVDSADIPLLFSTASSLSYLICS